MDKVKHYQDLLVAYLQEYAATPTPQDFQKN
jgi:hypothetical protein